MRKIYNYLSGSGHEFGGVEDVEKRRGVGVFGSVEERFRGRSSDGSELGEKGVFRVERGHWNFGSVNGARSFQISASPPRSGGGLWGSGHGYTQIRSHHGSAYHGHAAQTLQPETDEPPNINCQVSLISSLIFNIQLFRYILLLYISFFTRQYCI